MLKCSFFLSFFLWVNSASKLSASKIHDCSTWHVLQQELEYINVRFYAFYSYYWSFSTRKESDCLFKNG